MKCWWGREGRSTTACKQLACYISVPGANLAFQEGAGGGKVALIPSCYSPTLLHHNGTTQLLSPTHHHHYTAIAIQLVDPFTKHIKIKVVDLNFQNNWQKPIIPTCIQGDSC